MTRPESDTPGWRIRRARPSSTRAFILLLVIAATLFGALGYVVGSARNGGDEATTAVAPTAQRSPVTAAPVNTPLPAVHLPLPTALAGAPATPGSGSLTQVVPTAVPLGGTAPSTPRAAVTPGSGTGPGTGPQTGPGSGQTYTVVSGDTLLDIAAKHNVPPNQQDTWLTELRRLNNLQGDSIQIGQTLRLPPRN